ncbi:hypothetical protein U9M48_015632 [Paspalum notatum var. saurae]|uniref:Uncharacterized protein n=1 Tax=Paspalum notatum var. saurae TaxID=547442 RepID=A0AAQ3T3I4_PASNO
MSDEVTGSRQPASNCVPPLPPFLLTREPETSRAARTARPVPPRSPRRPPRSRGWNGSTRHNRGNSGRKSQLSSARHHHGTHRRLDGVVPAAATNGGEYDGAGPPKARAAAEPDTGRRRRRHGRHWRGRQRPGPQSAAISSPHVLDQHNKGRALRVPAVALFSSPPRRAERHTSSPSPRKTRRPSRTKKRTSRPPPAFIMRERAKASSCFLLRGAGCWCRSLAWSSASRVVVFVGAA